jgi:hypothetical protein
MYAHPLALNGLAQFSQLYAGSVLASPFSKGIAYKTAKERAAPFHFQGDHIHTPFLIVVLLITTLHRGFLLPGKFSLCRKLVFSHDFKWC